MRTMAIIAAVLCGLFTFPFCSAEARPLKHQVHPDCNVTMPCEGVVTSTVGQRVILAQRGFGLPVKTYTPMREGSFSTGIGPRPHRWCGWYMQQKTGVTSRGTGLNLNRAIMWAHVGRPAAPAPGVVVVWKHHVGMLMGQDARGRWIVHSGNDSHAVRERVRSIVGAVAFRAI